MQNSSGLGHFVVRRLLIGKLISLSIVDVFKLLSQFDFILVNRRHQENYSFPLDFSSW